MKFIDGIDKKRYMSFFCISLCNCILLNDVFCCLYTWLYGKNAVLRSGIVGLPNGWDDVFFTKDSPPKKRGIFFSVICRVPLFHRNEFDSALSNEDRGFILRLVGSYDCGMVFETVFSEERVDGNHAFFVDCRGKSLPRSVVDGLVEWFVPQKIVRFSCRPP